MHVFLSDPAVLIYGSPEYPMNSDPVKSAIHLGCWYLDIDWHW